MPEQSISRGKYNFNKHQKEKQNKVLQYYRRSFKSQLASVQQIARPRRTRKQNNQSIANGTGRIPKLTKTNFLEKDKKENKENIENKQNQDKEKELEQKNNEKSEIKNESTDKNQIVIMD